MGLFTSVLHVYQKFPKELIDGLKDELQQAFNVPKVRIINSQDTAFKNILDGNLQSGIAYLITEEHGNWTTAVEVAANLVEPFYIYELTNNISKRLETYALSFHLHDSDILLYNLDRNGEAMDGYNSDYQYFLDKPAEINDILSQRHSPQTFKDILPPSKNVDQFNAILNEGYWNAFDEGALDEDGIPADEHFVDEEDRFERVGKFLEIFSNVEYPFANWYHNQSRLNLDKCYLLIGER